MSSPRPPHFSYSRYGLQIDSTLECPGLKPGDGGDDIIIREGEVPERLSDPVSSGVLYQASPGRFLFNLDGTARYEVTDGRRIVVETASGSNRESVQLFLFGPPMAALLQQRGLLVLHGSAVEVDEEAVMFLGASGFGKSTLAAAFLRNGHQVLTDDICVIDVHDEASPLLLAGGRELKLWIDAVKELGLDPESLRRVRPEGRRRALVAPHDCHRDALSIRHVYWLQPAQDTQVVITRLSGADRFRALLQNVYQPKYLVGHGLLAVSFRQCSALAAHCGVSSVLRPVDSFRIEELYDRIHADLTSAP